MAGQMKTFWDLRLLIFFTLFIFTQNFEVREDEWEELGPDIAALHRLKGLSDRLFHESPHKPSSQRNRYIHGGRVQRSVQRVDSDQNPVVLQNSMQECEEDCANKTIRIQEFLTFVKTIEEQKVVDRLISASEISSSYSQKFIVMTDNETWTLDRALHEYSMDPHHSQLVSKACLSNASCLPEADRDTVVKIFGRVSEDGQTMSGLNGSFLAELMLKAPLEAAPVFSLDGNTTGKFHSSFVRTLVGRSVNAVLKIKQKDGYEYLAMTQRGPINRYQSPNTPVDHSIEYDHQQILIMENDETIKKAAINLYDKHQEHSSVYVLDGNRKPKLSKGDSVPLTENSRLVLVGHGVRDHSGEMKLAGLSAKEVAGIVEQTFRTNNKIKTTSVVACKVGSDKVFVETLLKELHETANIETELHARNALVQVRHTGEKITQEIFEDGSKWRHKDDSMKVVANIDRHKNVVFRNEPGSRGEPFFTDERNILYINEEINERFKTFRQSWPEAPQRFIDQNVLEEFDENAVKALNELEALSWGFFNEKLPRPRKVDIRNLERVNEEYIIGKHVFEKSSPIRLDWISDNNELQGILSKCYEVKSGEDVRNVIRHYAKDGENEKTYLMVKDWIYVVDPQSLYVYPVGKRLVSNQQRTEIMDLLKEQINNEHYHLIREKIVDKKSVESEIQSKRNYVEYLKGILTGKYSSLPTLTTEAWCTSYFTASVIAESARNFRTFPLILMGLDLVDRTAHATLAQLNFFFEDHSMANRATWIDPSRRGFSGSATAEGSSKLKNKRNKVKKTQLIRDLKGVLKAEVEQYKLWSNINRENDGSRLLRIAEDYNIFPGIATVDEVVRKYNVFKDRINEMSAPQASTSSGRNNDDQNLIAAKNVEEAFKPDSQYLRQQSLTAKVIQDQIKSEFGDNVVRRRVKEDSIRVEDDHVSFDLVAEGSEPVEVRAVLPPKIQKYHKNMLTSMKTFVDQQKKYKPNNPNSKFVEHTGTAVGVLGLMLGTKGTVNAFEQGDVMHGVVGTLQTAHGLAAITTAVMARRALSAELRVAAATVMRNPVMKRMMGAIPVVGIGFGLINLGEDISRGDPLGYIDAVLDSAMVVLDVVELVLAPISPLIFIVNMGISVLRMVIDDIYMGVENELRSLPKDAGTLEGIWAVVRGIWKGFSQFVVHVITFFYDGRYQEIEGGNKLVAKISDYHGYYTVERQSNTSVINFNRGHASWNGGGISFTLAEQGQSELCMDYFVSSNKTMSKTCWNISTEGSQDIILGLGESHGLEYKTLKTKVLMLIPAGSVRVVSGYENVPNSTYGTYKGNFHSNQFIAIQKANDSHTIEVMLSYHYNLYGELGDDIFLLGPQKSYVQGSGGKDTYIIHRNGGKTIINNYDDSKAVDNLHFSVNYSHISVSKSGSDVVLMFEGSHTVTIKSWFLGDGYRHMNMMSQDGVVFEISPTVVTSVRLVARKINKGLMTQNETVDTSQPLFRTVTTIFGSRYDDLLIGNGENNLIDGGGGKDCLIGGEGEDTYVVKGRQHSSVSIENNSSDQKTDVAIIEADLSSFNVTVDGDNLILQASADKIPINVTLVQWFRSPAHRHLHVVTKDLNTFTISGEKADCQLTDPFTKCMIPLRLNYSSSASRVLVDLEEDENLSSVTEVHGSDFDDVIRGNKGHNVIYPGKGKDHIQGRGGEDWYVITPGQGETTINNVSPDLKMDLLFLRDKYDNIQCTCEGDSLKISVNGIITVHLDQWFKAKKYQHLQIRSSDGVTAGLITKFEHCKSSSVMFPLIVDYRNQEPQPLNPPMTPSLSKKVVADKPCLEVSGEIFLCPKRNQSDIDGGNRGPVFIMTKVSCFTYRHKNSKERLFCNVKGKVIVDEGNSIQEMYGSTGFDIMIGNSSHSLLDPYTGGALMFGGEGRDTYIIKQGYGTVMINNFAQDLNLDTVLLDMDFLYDSQIKLSLLGQDLEVVITTKGGILNFTLLSFITDEQHQHLTFLSSDGVNFKLKPLNSTVTPFEIEAFKVTLNQPRGDCRLDLNSQKNLSKVHTVQGCPHQSNNLLGNALDNVLIGGWKTDVLKGDEGDDTLIGGNGDDLLVGDTGDDTLYGQDGNDSMMGDSGQDVLIPGPGADLMDGGPDRDAVVYRGDPETGKGVYVNLLTGQGRFADAEGDVLKNVETVIGTIYSDILVSGHKGSLLLGSDDNDILVSTGGDYLVGGDGHDIYVVAFNNGSVTINNCAKDNATDYIYIPQNYTNVYNSAEDRLVVSTFEKNQTVININVEKWSRKECQHMHLVRAV